MLHKAIGLCLVLLSFNSYGEEPQTPISEDAAKAIALSVAGCKESDHCVVNGTNSLQASGFSRFCACRHLMPRENHQRVREVLWQSSSMPRGSY
jgi:hypothetical protein